VTRSGAVVLCLIGLATSSAAPTARAEEGASPPVDLTVVRYYAPETGGPGRPRFIAQRILAYEARLEAKAEDTDAPSYQDRHVRAAMDHHIAEELLAALPLERPPDDEEISRVASELRAALMQRVGGDAALKAALEAERISEGEVASLFRRRARAAIYVERQLERILYPKEEQLREVYRTAAHPYKSLKFDDARLPLARWYVDERLRVAESSFLQAARSRVKITVTDASTS
jgi:hypothetical protein